MAITFLKLTVSNPRTRGKGISCRFLVDSGAVYSVIPTKLLRKLRIKPIDKQTFLLANGEEVEKQIGEARFLFRKKERTAPVLFGDPNLPFGSNNS